jgi:hypothetical protein
VPGGWGRAGGMNGDGGEAAGPADIGSSARAGG